MVRFSSLSIIFTLVTGGLVTLFGFSQLSWPDALPFSLNSLPYSLVYILVCAVVVEICSRYSKVARLHAGFAIAVAIAIFAGALYPLLVTVWFALSSYVLGLAILSVLKIDSNRIPGVTTLLLGAVAYGTAVGLLAHYPLNFPGVYGFALAIPLLLGWRSLTQILASLTKKIDQPSSSIWLDLAIVLVALFHFSVALMPEVGHDALAMHLFIPNHLAHRHEWGFDVNTYVWAVMPMMGDWIFSIGYMLAGETAARMINVGFIFILSWLVRDLVIWGGGNRVGARWAVLLFLTTPLTFTESSSLFIESVWTALVISGALSIFKVLYSEDDQKVHLPVAGILLGGALAAKAVTFTVLPVLLILLVFGYRIWFKWRLSQSLTMGLALFITVGAIPYITAWNLTGNPVFPFFNHLFQSPYYPDVKFEDARYLGKGLTWDMLYQATFHTEIFMESRPGSIGFQWLLLFVPALLSLIFSQQHRGIILFVVAILSIALTFQSTAYLRYVYPSFAWLAAGIGVALSTGVADSIFTKKLLYLVGWMVVLLNVIFLKSGTYYGDLSLRPLTSSSGREDYLRNQLPIRSAVGVVNRLNTGRTPVAVFSTPLTAGLNADALYPNWYNHKFEKRVSNAQSSKEIAQLLLDKGVEYIILDGNWGSAEKRAIIEGATQKLEKMSSITIREVKSRYRFKQELISNPDFYTTEGWSSNSGLASGQVAVSVAASVYQKVPVSGGRRYLNSVLALCSDQPGQGRLQVNWLDSKSDFIETDIQVFDCTQLEVLHSMEVIAPHDASSALVYASGQTEIPIIFKMVSFKQ